MSRKKRASSDRASGGEEDILCHDILLCIYKVRKEQEYDQGMCKRNVLDLIGSIEILLHHVDEITPIPYCLESELIWLQ